jgi:hypothetical protein
VRKAIFSLSRVFVFIGAILLSFATYQGEFSEQYHKNMDIHWNEVLLPSVVGLLFLLITSDWMISTLKARFNPEKNS